MQSLITENNLTFSKPKCNCGIVSKEQNNEIKIKIKIKKNVKKNVSTRTKSRSRKQNKK
jgi:hypothetical protein